MDQFTEVVEISWFARFRNAIGGLVFAPLFFLAGFMMLKHGEISHAKTTIGLKNIVGKVKSVENANYGDLVHVTDVVKSPDKWLIDEQTGLDLKALKLYRKVYTWQWVEKKKEKKKRTVSGGTKKEIIYNYETRWVSDFRYSKEGEFARGYEVDSDKFKHPLGHENPKHKPYASRLFTHEVNLKLGEYDLDRQLQKAILNFQLLETEENMFPVFSNVQLDRISSAECPGRELHRSLGGVKMSGSNEAGGGKTMGGGIGASYGSSRGLKTNALFLGNGNPELPMVGDTRIEYWYIPDGVYTFVAKKSGNLLEPYANDSLFIRSDLPCGGYVQMYNKAFSMVFSGKQTIKEMFRVTHKENDILHIVVLRFGGLVFVVAGFLLFGNPLRLLFGWIPFIGYIWEKVVFKLMQVLGTLTAICISVFYFLKHNNISNLTIYDFYFGIAVVLFLLFVHNLSVSVSSGGEEVYSEDF